MNRERKKVKLTARVDDLKKDEAGNNNTEKSKSERKCN